MGKEYKDCEQQKDKEGTIENNVLKGKVVPWKLRYSSLGHLLFDKLKNNPNVVGQMDALTDEEDTFASMLDRAIKCALWLKEQGVKQGDIVAISTHNHLDSFVPCIAALFIGAIFSPWNYSMDIRMGRQIINITQPKFIFVDKETARGMLEVVKIEMSQTQVVCFGNYPGTIPFSEVLSDHDQSSIDNFRHTEIDDPRQTAMILFTSGTTGVSKGAEFSHEAWLIRLEEKEIIDWGKQRTLFFSATYWISNVFITLKSIVVCAKRIIPPDFDEKIACELFQKFKVTWTMLCTSMASRWCHYKSFHKYDFSNLKMLGIGGTVAKGEFEDLLRKKLPNAFVVQTYGMTELGVLFITQIPSGTSGSCGTAPENVEIKFVDPETGKPLGPNQNGELCIKTPTGMSGYYKDPVATRGIIDKEGWIHTGDLAYHNEKGEIFIIDRLKELIKYRGNHIMPAEVENILQLHPAVLEAVVVGIPHIIDGEHPVAFVSTVENREVTAEELIKIVNKNFTDSYKLRGGVKFMRDLPHTATGKIARKELKVVAKRLPVKV